MGHQNVSLENLCLASLPLPPLPPTSLENDDGTLMQKIRQGDEQALSILFNRHSRIVYSVALKILRDTASAEDILQEVFMQIWRTRPSIEVSKIGLGPWLSVVSRNRSITVLRSKHPTEPLAEFNLPSSYDLESEAECDLMSLKANLLIAKMSVVQRELLQMAFFEGLSHSEISALTGYPLGTVKTKIRGALATIRKGLQPERCRAVETRRERERRFRETDRPAEQMRPFTTQLQ
jgi:RNA polymerase sigma-70 factor (ECF subfamily)